MAAPAAILDIIVRTDTAGATAGLARTQGALKATEAAGTRTTRALGSGKKGLSGAFRGLGLSAGFGAAAIGAGLVIALKKSVDQAREAEKAHAQTQAVIKSMGNQANVTAGHIEKLANKISLVAGVDDEAIQQTENLLLTFANLRNETGKGNAIFDRTTQIVTDMSAALGQSLKSSAIQVGKALNDPTVGLTALRRVGVSFNATQTETIQKLFESGKQMKAQKLILRELNKEFAGSAAAQADPFDKLKVAIENIEESLGKKVLPVMAQWANAIAKFINQMNTGKGAGGDFAKALRNIGKVLADLWPIFKLTWDLMWKWWLKPMLDAIPRVIGAAKAVVGAFKDVLGWFKTAWKDVGEFIAAPFRKAVGVITGFINDIIGVINTVLGPVGVHIGEVGGGGGGSGKLPKSQTAPHSKKASQKQRGGMMVPGSGSGDTVPALLEPGEFVLNRRAVAAVGQSKLDKFNKDVPRFSVGSFVKKTPVGGAVAGLASGGVPDLPGVGGLPGWLQPAGDFVRDAVGGFIKKKLAAAVSGVGGDILNTKSGAATLKSLQSSHPELQPGITQVLAAVLANNSGLSITSTTGGSHVSGSYHYQGRAVDIAGSSGAMSSASTWIKGSGLYKLLAEGIHNPNLAVSSGHIYSGAGPFGAVWADHLNHIHLARQKGGGISPHSPGRPAVGGSWLKGVGGHWDPDEIYTALRQLGAPKDMAGFLSAVSVGESGGNPRAIGHDPGGTSGLGLLQITTGFNDDIIAKYGGRGGVMNPWENLLAGMDIYRRQGPGAWYGHQGTRGQLLASRIAGAAKVGKTKKGKKGKGTTAGPTGNADLITGAYGAALDQYAERAGLANELIGEGNFEALQRYQVGAQQNPVLGIASPGMPTPTPAMSTSPSPAQLLSILAGSTPGLGGKASKGATVHNHNIYVDGKALKGGITKVTRSQSRRGHRPLPSAKG